MGASASAIAAAARDGGLSVLGYTSQARFLVKGSGHDHGNNGRSMVVSNEADVPQGVVLCPENCRTCRICMTDSRVDIAFIER